MSDVVKVLKTKDKLEIANSNESKHRSEVTDSVRMVDSEMPNQLKVKRKKGQHKMRQLCDSKGVGKGRTSKPEEREEPQVELEGEC